MPHVAMSATPANAIASSVFLRSPEAKTSSAGERPGCRAEAFHRSDSGTKSRMKNVSTAGAAPTIITQRHESRAMGNAMPITAMKA